MKTPPAPATIVVLATTITKLQAERLKASTRMNAIASEMSKLGEVLARCDKAQLEAQREMDKLAARPMP